jgi:hypothetical protein
MQVNFLSTPIHFEYRWQEGSVPPPEHYGFTIKGVTTGEGQIVFVPGYPNERCAHWVETFHIDPLKATSLAELLRTVHVFDRQWPEVPDDTVGGSQRSFLLIRGSSRVDIPAQLSAGDTHAADALELVIRALVPDDIWHALRNRHAAYLEHGCL